MLLKYEYNCIQISFFNTLIMVGRREIGLLFSNKNGSSFLNIGITLYIYIYSTFIYIYSSYFDSSIMLEKTM